MAKVAGPLVWSALSVATVFLLVYPASARAARIDVDSTSTLLTGSILIATRHWNYPFETGSEDQGSQVWFDGTTYTYLYAIYNPGDLDGVSFVRGGSVGGETNLDLFELETDLPADTTWGFVAEDPPNPGPLNASATSTLECATLTGDPGVSPGCDSALARVTYPPFTLDGHRLRGALGGSNTTLHMFYLLSDKPPTLVPSLALFSSEIRDEEIPVLDEWYILRTEVDVFAPVPEPASLLLLGSGGAILLRRVARRRRT